MTGVVLCAFCGEPVQDPQHAYQRVRGWARRRDGGGLNALRLREELPEVAHVTCVETRAAGRAGQGGLFDV